MSADQQYRRLFSATSLGRCVINRRSFEMNATFCARDVAEKNTASAFGNVDAKSCRAHERFKLVLERFKNSHENFIKWGDETTNKAARFIKYGAIFKNSDAALMILCEIFKNNCAMFMIYGATITNEGVENTTLLRKKRTSVNTNVEY